VPPSCINRDDTGSPKIAVYGGTRRSRVSSQAWKKAVRDYLKKEISEKQLGIRTKLVVDTVLETIISKDSSVINDNDIQEKIRETINFASVDKKNPIIPSIKIDDILKDIEEAFNESEDDDEFQNQIIKELNNVCNDLKIDLIDNGKISDFKKSIKKMIPLSDKDESKNDEKRRVEQEIISAIIKNVETVKINTENDALFFFGYDEKEAIADLVIKWIKNNQKPTVNEVKTALNSKDQKVKNLAVDIALFGRMVAKAPIINADASAQVAHAISTHTVYNEFDFFTALGESPKEIAQSGAEMMGTIEYNSSTLYRYATVALHDLKTYVGENTANAAAIFTKAFICSMPTGKQNTFANRTLPYAAYICLRKDQPINLVGAFEIPVKSSKEGFELVSSKKLEEHAVEIYKIWADQPENSYAIGEFELGEKTTLNELIEKLATEISKKI
jgi:CRISPR system Cascade subunit CasC